MDYVTGPTVRGILARTATNLVLFCDAHNIYDVMSYDGTLEGNYSLVPPSSEDRRHHIEDSVNKLIPNMFFFDWSHNQ